MNTPPPGAPEAPRFVHPEALAIIRSQLIGASWAAYQNQDLGSEGLGEMRFLAYGPGLTFLSPPSHYPDSHLGTGWRYLLVGWVEVPEGRIVLGSPPPGLVRSVGTAYPTETVSND